MDWPVASLAISVTRPTSNPSGNTSPMPVVITSSPTVAWVLRGRLFMRHRPSEASTSLPVTRPLSRVRLTMQATLRAGFRIVTTLAEV